MADSSATKRTLLCDSHKKLGAKMVPFGGWDMPVSYESVLAEHAAVRNQCGVFDVSHMGEVRVSGPDATHYMLKLTMNDVTKLKAGEGQYSGILLPSGGMIDDLILYRVGPEEYFICVNASNADKDFAWFSENKAGFNVHVVNESSKWSQLAVQGPSSPDAVSSLLSTADAAALAALPYMGIAEITLFGLSALIARTGYTGERGYEIYLPNDVAIRTWDALLATNDKTGIKPIGLGARDTLRLEACYLLYGNDMNETVSPLEAGVGWAVKLDRVTDFIGRDSLRKVQASGGPKRKIFAFKMKEQGIPRAEMGVFVDGQEVGKVTSGSVLPTLGGAGGMALLDAAKVSLGQTVEIDVRGKRKLAEVVRRPLYSARIK